MKNVKNRISERAAIQLLKRLFVTDADVVTLEDAYVAAGRGSLSVETNRNWINNVMTKLAQHNLIAPDYRYDGRKRLVGIRLTLTGRTALGRPQPTELKPRDNSSSTPPLTNDVDVTYNDVAKAVRLFRDNNPEFEVVFRVTLKDMPMQQ